MEGRQPTCGKLIGRQGARCALDFALISEHVIQIIIISGKRWFPIAYRCTRFLLVQSNTIAYLESNCLT